MRNDATQDRYFSKTSLGRYLNRSTRWVDYQIAGPNPLPGFKVGRDWLFKKSEIDRWLEQFRAGADVDKVVAEMLREVGVGE